VTNPIPSSTRVPINYLYLLRQKNFALLWSARSVSLVGDVVFLFSVNWLILEKTGSAFQVGGNIVVQVLTDIIFASIAGVLADWWPRRRIMLSSDLLRGGLVLCLALLLRFTPFNIWYIYFVTFFLTALTNLFTPAFQATLPNVLEKEALITGRSLTVGTARLLQTLGSAISGVLIAMTGPLLGIAINATSFFLSALAIFFTTIPESGTKNTSPLTTTIILGNMRDGWRFIQDRPILVSLFLLFTLSDFGAAFTWPVHVVFAEKILHGGSQLYGYLGTAALLGGFCGAFFIGRYSKWFNRYVGWSYFTAAFAWGLLSILYGMTSVVSLALGYRFLIGWTLSMIHVPISALLDSKVEDQYRGRIWSTIGIGSSLVSPISVGLSGILADHWSARVSYIVAGSLLIVSAFLVLRLPGIRGARIEST